VTDTQKRLAERLGLEVYAGQSAPDDDPVVSIAYRQPNGVWSPVLADGDRIHFKLWRELVSTTERLERISKAAECDWKSERERSAVYATLEASVTVLKAIALYNTRSPDVNRLPDNIMRMVADVQYRLDEVTFNDKPTNS
jgi:hypothetical protein